VEAMDVEIRRLLMSLPVSVLANTWVIFVADNGTPGPAISDPALRAKGKGTMYESGIRVPLIVMGPGVVDPGREVRALVNTTDIFTTVLQMAGIPGAAQHLPSDSVSLMPYLTDPTAAPQREWAYSELFLPNGPGPYIERRRVVRNERFKLLEIAREGFRHRAMFDLKDDPTESTDLLVNGMPPANRVEVFYELLELMSNIVSSSPPGDDDSTRPPLSTRPTLP
jgi:arylsulfatase A-like enzyme